MTTPTAGELALLRSQPQQTKLFLSIFEPQTFFAAQVNDAGASKGDMVITYNNVTAGSFLDVSGGMTLYVGTTPGSRDKGSIFVYGRDATTITVGENSHINWEDDDYLTIVNFHQIWPTYPRYIQDEEDITVFKVYNVAYIDQNEDLGSFIVMGSNYAGFIDSNTGTAQVYWDASESENLIGTTGSSYTWSFEGGTPTGSAAITPGWVTYDTPGHYRTLLRIQTPLGNADIGIRHVSIYDRPGVGPDNPILQWGINEFSGSREEGGYSGRLWVKQDVANVVDGALIVIFADDTYGDTVQSIGGNSAQREKIVFVGYILDGSIDYDYKTSTVSFDVGSPTEIMKLGEAFSVSVEDSNDPTADANNKGGDPWFYLVGLTVKTALYHYYRWHSSVYTLMDIRYIGDDFSIQFFDADRTSLYDAGNTLLKSVVFGASVSDRQGALYFEIDASAIDDAENNLNASMFVDSNDWMGSPSIVEQYTEEVSYLEAGGVINFPGSGTFAAVLAAAPGETPAYRGKNMKLSGFALSSQAQLNTLVGNIWENMNADFPEVSLDLVGNYRNLDIAPQEIVTLTLKSEDTFRGLEWEQKAFTPRAMSWTYDSLKGLFLPTINLNEITQGNAGESIVIPVAPPDGGFEQPPIQLPPPVPPIPIPIPSFGGAVTFFAPALMGRKSSLALLNFGSAWNSPSTDGELGVGIQLDRDTTTIAEGWFAMPFGATSAIIYGVFQPRGDSGNLVFENEAEYGPCGVAHGDLVNTTSGDVIYTPDTSAAHVCEIPITISANEGDIVQMLFSRKGGNGSDTNSLRTFFYGWLVVAS